MVFFDATEITFAHFSVCLFASDRLLSIFHREKSSGTHLDTNAMSLCKAKIEGSPKEFMTFADNENFNRDQYSRSSTDV